MFSSPLCRWIPPSPDILVPRRRFAVILSFRTRLQIPSAIRSPMPRFLSQHTLACLTRQGAQDLTRRLLDAKEVAVSRVLVNMYEGKMLAEFSASTREEVENWLAREKFHFDWLLRIELESDASGALQQAP
jgi:hypothetical protein